MSVAKYSSGGYHNLITAVKLVIVVDWSVKIFVILSTLFYRSKCQISLLDLV
jgi:hypothetical protein